MDENKITEEQQMLVDAMHYFHDAGMDAEEGYCLHRYMEKPGIMMHERVLVVCIDCDEEINAFIQNQTYKNIECLSLRCDTDFFDKLSDYLGKSSCSYVTFLEKNQKAMPEKIEYLLKLMLCHQDINAAICMNNFVDETGALIAHPDFIVSGIAKPRCVGLSGQRLSGKSILHFSLTEEINVLGTLSCILVKSENVKQCIPLKKSYMPIMETAILYNIILNCSVMISEKPMVDIVAAALDQNVVREKQNAFFDFLSGDLGRVLGMDLTGQKFRGLPRCYTDDYGVYDDIQGIGKKMTFYYTDKAEYYNLQPLADEARRRGYEVVMTNDREEPSEIGFYSYHCADPENSKFSVVLLHDMEQGHTSHPNLWWWERWNKFDLGILPGPAWKDRWEVCAGFGYANTKKGVFAMGYPKSDYVHSEEIRQRTRELKSKMNLKYEKTVLYAPSWENDGKEDDFICALSSMQVNLLIKQAHWPPKYGHIIKNIQEQRKLHEGKYDNVYYVEPEESILVALAMSDMIISDESSVMTEGLMFGIPSLAVTDWLIPDQSPSRFASVPMDYVFKCKKADLREWAEKVLYEVKYQEQVENHCSRLFANIGNCCRDVLDCVEYYTAGRQEAHFQQHRLMPRYMPSGLWY